MPLKRIAALSVLTCFPSVSMGQIVSVQDLEPASGGGAGQPLFERMDTERTGIAFENRFDHPRRWRELWKQYYNGSIGTGVALGDMDGDGLPDLFAVGKDSPNGLFRNGGDFRFEDVTALAGVAGGTGFGTGAAWVDIDGDGDLDLYVCYVSGTNELWVNDGSGRFENRAADWGLDYRGGSNAPSFADYDRDGDLDLYLQQNYLHGSESLDGLPDLLFRNDEGRFVDVTEQAGIAGEGQGHTALWWDFDEDGWLDIYVSNDFEAVDKLYRNNKDGTFSDVIREALGSAPYSSMGVDAGDLNNDGHADLIAAEMLARDREYYHRAVGPLSGKLIGARRSGVNQYMQNMVWAALGDGRFAEVSRFAGLHASDWTWATRFVDLDNDGLLDVFFANGMTRAFHDGDLAYQMTKARSLATRVRVFEASPPLRERNLAFRNDGDFRFSEVSEAWGLAAEGVSFAAAFADFDLDGDLDLVTSNWKEGLGVYRNNSGEGQRLALRLEGVQSNRMGLGATVRLETRSGTQTRELSSMRGYMSVDDPTLHFAATAGDAIKSLVVEWPSGKRQRLEGLAFGKRYTVREDVLASSENGPKEKARFQRSDIWVDPKSERLEDRFFVRRGQALLPFTEDRLGPAMALADLDGDGFKDVLLGGATGQALVLLRNEGGRALRAVAVDVFEDDELAEDSAIVPFDFDGDGDLDLFVSSGGVELDAGDEYYADRLYLNQGGLEFERADFESPPEASSAAVRLENGLMLLAGGTVRGWYPQAHDNRVYSREGELLPHAFAESGRTARLVLADLDADGDRDVVQLREYASPLAGKQEADELREWPEVFAGVGSGLWKSAAVADFNGDGRLDIVLGNLGENNKYAVSEESPAVLWAPREETVQGKYIEAEAIDGVLYPRESRIFHQLDFPEIAKRTGAYAEYAKMSVGEAFGEEVLEAYDRYEFTERRSLLLLQDETGGFRRERLPALAQAGTAIDLLAADFDGDGDVDVAAILQSLSPQPVASVLPESSFVLLLINDGKGVFRCELPGRSGVSIEKGAARRLVWSDLDGDGRCELLVAISEGPLYVFAAGE
ncbi:VCBS repeat-containing protein [Pelagicoccus sp. SDUM812005]|uniref:VCBS repeat-containing protein n=1 Tax=Pelagicoccus sp. SDUM812005 TaxID=3041257 RepID=UPI00280E440E|nr:VCBS repeat-containing protein [Pelagicoccus sp. SDUM812005]MDQ8180672.1 VCBS repeat-containing protein [Pelagicoccus sp. SDUM812005]